MPPAKPYSIRACFQNLCFACTTELFGQFEHLSAYRTIADIQKSRF